MDGIPNINFYYVLTFFYFFWEFDDGGVGGVVGLPLASFLYGYFC